jgi:hypothetical protein
MPQATEQRIAIAVPLLYDSVVGPHELRPKDRQVCHGLLSYLPASFSPPPYDFQKKQKSATQSRISGIGMKVTFTYLAPWVRSHRELPISIPDAAPPHNRDNS